MRQEEELDIGQNIEKVRARIYQAAQRSGRNENEIDLIAVTKQKPAALIKELIENGIKRIGESYVKEALFKIDLLKEFDIEWHMIGNIQRGREKNVANHFQVVHSIGSLKTAQEINRFAHKNGKTIQVYLELNVSGEASKHGWDAASDNRVENMLLEIEEILTLGSLKVTGLMTMAPYSNNPEDARVYFVRMRQIRERIRTEIPDSGITGLSMGMSGDFEVAVEEGATVLRIGSALVGPR